MASTTTTTLDIEDPMEEWSLGVFNDTLLSNPVFEPALECAEPVEDESDDVSPPRFFDGLQRQPLAKNIYFQFPHHRAGQPKVPFVKVDDETVFMYPEPLKEGTLKGTTVAASEFYRRVIERYESYYDIAGFEQTIPQYYSVRQRNDIYQWKLPESDISYPPHLSVIPKADQAPTISVKSLISGIIWWALGWFVPKHFMTILSRIFPRFSSAATTSPLEAVFNSMRFLNTAVILGQIFPTSLRNDVPREGYTIQQCEDQNASLRAQNQGIYTVDNIGEWKEWYTDAMFAQQHLTGPNPATLKSAAGTRWAERFALAATEAGNFKMEEVIREAGENGELYVQDYSDFREAAGVGSDEELSVAGAVKGAKAGKGDRRYACAPVCLFRLYGKQELVGKLHPLAIVLDWRVPRESKFEDKPPSGARPMGNSIVTFNKRLSPNDNSVDQSSDWPWRYAKTCVQSADWTRHEVAVHLVHTHFIEEAVIVAANRSFHNKHPVYLLLKPHWLKTLSLNAAARSTLVPQVVVPLVGMSTEQLLKFAKKAYDTFSFQTVPEDLRSRGFIPEELDNPRYKNCAYARNIYALWKILHEFVTQYLDASDKYKSDADVRSDGELQAWCDEMTSAGGAGLDFPRSIDTRQGLVDILTMCIHIASPQHTAVNYLQEFYQVFVINKPPALYTPIPTKWSDWASINEQALTAALPIHVPRAWLLAAHVPHLLNMTVASEQNLVNYAHSLYQSVKPTDGKEPTEEQRRMADAARGLWTSLVGFRRTVDRYSADMDVGTERPVPYLVLKPDVTAVSILI
ncbi:hypothetical protein RUND412_005836 [Rhizina undulata]